MVELRALGNAEIRTEKATITPSQEIVFASTLYLVLQKGKRTSRRGLAELIWPAVELAKRSHRFRQTLLQLKRVGVPLRVDRDTICLDPEEVCSDFGEIESLAPEALVHCNSLEFLPGYSPRFSEPFRDWVDMQRSELQSICTRALLPVLRERRTKGDWAEVERIARRSLSIDPYNESFVLALAEASAMRGQKREAVSLLDDYLREVGSANSDLRIPATMLRRRISDAFPTGRSQASVDPDFLGREREMEQLTACLRDAQRSRGDAIFIQGEPGIGKSRLGLELGKFAELQGVNFQRVGCRRSDIDRPLSVFVDLVPQLRELPGALGCSQETLLALKRLTEFDGRGTHSLLSFEELTSLYYNMRRALLDLLDAIAEEQCLLICVEDVQWLDPTSARLFAEIVEWSRTRKLLFLFNARSGPSSFSESIAPEIRAIELLPLERVYAQQLLRAMVTPSSVAEPAVFDWILSVGEGNPFFLQELAKHWVETGHQHDVPPSIATVLNNRLSRISTEALYALQAVAVLGEHATLDRIEAVLEYKSHTLLAAVQELSMAGMLNPSGRDSIDRGGLLRVRHDLISTAAVGALAPASLAYLHKRAGSILEHAIGGARSATSLLWACAFHWGNAGDRGRALAVARSCAEHVLEVGLPVDAVQAFERALEYCITDEDRLNVYSRMVVALQTNSQWEQSRKILAMCRRLRQQIAPEANQHDDIEIRLYDATWRASLETHTLLAQLLSCAECVEAPAPHRVACGLLGLKVATNFGETELMRQLYQHVQGLLEVPGVPPTMRFEVEMVFNTVCGNIDQALQAMEQFLVAVRAEKNPLTFSRSLGNAARVYRIAGRTDEAAALFAEAVEHALSHGFHNQAASAHFALVWLFLSKGDIREARRFINKAQGFECTGEDVHYNADRIYLSARLALEEDDIDTAWSLYQAAESALNPNQVTSRRSAVLALGVRIGVRAGMSEEIIRPKVEQLEAIHLTTRTVGGQDFEAVSVFFGLRAIGQEEKAATLLQEYAETYRLEKWPLPQEISDCLAISVARTANAASCAA